MGSGAAVATAIVRAICNALGRHLDNDQVSEMAMESEREYHGSPSGVDVAVAARNEPIYFVKDKQIQSITLGPGVFRFVIADTGINSPTVNVVRDIAEARKSDRARYDSYFWEIGSMTTVTREVLKSGSPEELGLCMNNAHNVLVSLGVSCCELDDLVAVALDKGALGAKLSGAGRGGVVIALLDDNIDQESFINDLHMAGAENVLTTVLAANAVC